MKTHKSKIVTLASLIAVAAIGVTNANATLILYTVGGDSATVGGDVVSLAPNLLGAVDVTPNGAPVKALLNNVTWTATALDSSGDYSGSLDRQLTINLNFGASQTLSQSLEVHIVRKWLSDKQTLTIDQGAPVFFNWDANGQQYNLEVTALEFGPLDANVGLGTVKCGDLYGEFQLTAVPEPSTIISGALVLIPFATGAFRTLRKNKQ